MCSKNCSKPSRSEREGRQADFGTIVPMHMKLIGHSVRTDRFSDIEWDERHGRRKLYDHESDPHELHNPADKPMRADRIGRMKVTRGTSGTRDQVGNGLSAHIPGLCRAPLNAILRLPGASPIHQDAVCGRRRAQGRSGCEKRE